MAVRGLKKGLAACLAVASLSAALAMTTWAKDRLETVSDLYWEGEEDDDGGKVTEAVWEEVDDAYQYRVRLYRDGSSSSKAEVTTKKTSFNFKRYMTTEGEYTFKVQALARKGSKEYLDSHWSEESEGRYVSASRAESNASRMQEDTSKGGPGADKGQDQSQGWDRESGVVRPDGSADYTSHLPIPGSGVSDTENKNMGNNAEGSRKPMADGEKGQDAQEPAQQEPGQWVKAEAGWWYRRPDGSYPCGQWFQDPEDGNWYKFDGQGYMATGWIVEGGERYYCDPDGSPAGAMATGERTIKGVLYTFDSSGAMKDDYIPSVGSSSRED